VEPHLPRHGHPVVRHRHHAVLPVAGPVHALPTRLTPSGVQNLIQVDQYMSFAMSMMLVFGLVFEVPVLIVILNLTRVLTHDRFRRWRRALIFGVFVIAGMANLSPDPLTMLIVGGTCASLVEAAEFIARSSDRPARSN
jgi:sec-independent protein translocase protein TatC